MASTTPLLPIGDQMKFEDMLLPKEQLIFSKAANAVFGLNFDQSKAEHRYQALYAITKGLWELRKFQDSIGGQLYLTNYRLLFMSHSVNIHRGTFSIFLSTIRGEKNIDGWISDRLTINTQTSTFTFLLREGEIIDKQLQQLPTVPDVELRSRVLTHPERIATGVTHFWDKDQPTEVAAQQCHQAIESGKANVLDVAGLVCFLELINA